MADFLTNIHCFKPGPKESEWQRVQRLRAEGKTKGGKFVEVPGSEMAELEHEMFKAKQRKYQLENYSKEKRWDYFKNSTLKLDFSDPEES